MNEDAVALSCSDRIALDEQIAYYKSVAGSWSSRPVPEADRLAALSWLREEAPCGDLLELACGTGRWTVALLDSVRTITVLDSSAEMLAINRRKCSSALDARPIPYRAIEANIFSWLPDAQYDVVFFAYWLSHIPTTAFGLFWQIVRQSLNPHGRVLFVDSRRVVRRWREKTLELAGSETRIGGDGNVYRIIKKYHERDELLRRINEVGFGGRIEPAGSAALTGCFTPV
jgi:ubiquinone/menaquinone biosynthesis C-methylase UbiE